MWLLLGGGMCGCCWGEGMCGCSRGACVVALGACMVALGGACMVALGGHVWLLGGACMVAARGTMHGCSGVGVCGCSGGACMVALGAHAWLLPGGRAWDMTRYGDTVNELAVRILRECILVITRICYDWLNRGFQSHESHLI